MKMKYLFTSIIIFVIFCVFINELNAQYNKKRDIEILQYDYRFKQNSTILGNDDLDDLASFTYPTNFYVSVTSDPGTNCPAGVEYIFQNAKLYVVLKMGSEDYNWGDNDFELSITDIKVESKDAGNNDINRYYFDLHIQNDNANSIHKPEELEYVDVTNDLNNGAVKFQIIDIDDYDVSSMHAKFEPSVTLEMFIVYDIAYLPRLTSEPTDPIIEIVSPAGVDISSSSNGLVTFSWKLTPTCDISFFNYQLQILRLFDTDSNKNSYKSKVDWSKAMVYETGNSETSVALSLVEGTGFYVWRVRPISTYFDGGIANYRNWGAWSPTDDCGSGPSFDDGTEADLSSYYGCAFYYKQFDENINWKYVRNFAEGDYGTTVMESIQYADNLLKVRQEQTYINTDITKLVKQNVYDFIGRSALTTLPVPIIVDPIGNKEHLGFSQQLTKDNPTIGNPTLYTAFNFDVSSSISDNFKDPEPLNADLGEPFRYYAGVNIIEKHVPSSEELPYTSGEYFPYARNIYYQDGTGRIKEQSGFGGNHRIGTDRTVRTFYSAVSDDEIVPLFGSEAPAAKRIHKIINIDQNGVANISYQLANGRVLATCLNVNQLDNNSPLLDLEYNLMSDPFELNESYLQITAEDIFENEVRIGNRFTTSKNFSFADPTDVEFTYDLEPSVLDLTEIFCDEYCATCDYVIEILIKKIEDGTIVYSESDVVSVATDCEEPTPINLTIDKTLEPGSYIFERNVYVNNIDPSNNSTYLEGYINELIERIDEEMYDYQLATVLSKLNDLRDGIIEPEELYEFLENENWEYDDTEEGYEFYYFVFECCDTIKISKYECPKCLDDFPFDEHDELDFEKYLKDALIEKLGSYGDLRDYFFNYGGSKLYPEVGTNGNGKFNELVKNMLDEQLCEYDSCEVWNCWKYLVDYYELLGLNPDGTLNQDFNLLDAFLTCTGKMYIGPSSTLDPYDQTDGYLTYAYKHFKECDSPINVDICEICLELVEDEFGEQPWGNDICGPSQETGPNINTDKRWELYYNCIARAGTNFVNDYEIDRKNKYGNELSDCFDGFPSQSDYTANEQLLIDELEAIAECIIGNCESHCEDRLINLEQKIIDEYNDMFLSVQTQTFRFDDNDNVVELSPELWDIVGENAHDIYLADVRCMAESLVEMCQSTCPELPVVEKIIEGKKYYVFEPDSIDKLHQVLFNNISVKLYDDGCDEGYTHLEIEGSKHETKLQSLANHLNKVLNDNILANLHNDSRPLYDTCRIFGHFKTLATAYYSVTGNPGCFKWLTYCDTPPPPKIRKPIILLDSLEFDEFGCDTINCETIPCYEKTCPCCDDYVDTYHTYIYDPSNPSLNESCFTCNEFGKYVPDNENTGIIAGHRFRDRSVMGLLFFPYPPFPPNTIDSPYYLFECSEELNYPYLARFLSNWIFAFDNKPRPTPFAPFFSCFQSMTNEYEFVVHDNRLILKYTTICGDNSDSTGLFTTYYFHVCCPQFNSCSGDICYKWEELPEIDLEDIHYITREYITCEMSIFNKIMSSLHSQVNTCVDIKIEEMKLLYNETCLDDKSDITKLQYDVEHYHYTLYYYDRAGNLVKTIPSKGVNINPSATRTGIPPLHYYASIYNYNSLGQITRSTNPDHLNFYTNFYYDKKQQIRFSEEPNQIHPHPLDMKIPYEFSYTHYDELGRVIESGAASAGILTDTYPTPVPHNKPESVIDEITSNAYPPNPWKKMLVKTYYSRPAPWLPEPYDTDVQNNLENRVSFTFRDADGDPETSWDQAWTFYSYDPHGNVEWLIHKLSFNLVFKIEYEYDLISGNVKKVYLNKNRLDEFYYQYKYDSDNRLQRVFTSRHGELWDQDAKYHYYHYGPLKRIEIGEDKIQGIDYAYTINGWLKGINSSFLSPQTDLGNDAHADSANPKFAYDEFGMMLSYFDNDYYAQNSSFNYISDIFSPLYNLLSSNDDNSLYNGNIAAWEYCFRPNIYTTLGINFILKSGYLYTYDVLGRLKKANYKKYYDIHPPPPPPKVWYNAPDLAYTTEYTYDPNSNMTLLSRNGPEGNSDIMDDLEYNFQTFSFGQIKTNRIDYIDDNGIQNQELALKNQEHKYVYDFSGNMIKDTASEINRINYTADGKVEFVEKQGANFMYIYDARGDRVVEAHLGVKYTYYVRDANGEILEILIVRVDELPGEGYENDPWVVVPGHPIVGTGGLINTDKDSKKGKGDIYTVLSGCPSPPSSSWTEEQRASAPWYCWPDTLDLDIIDIELNPFLDPTNQVDNNEHYISVMHNEWYIYGNSSHGRFGRAFPIAGERGYSTGFEAEKTVQSRHLKHKQYELKDHLGNVRVVVSDFKMNNQTAHSDPPYYADVLSVYNYYPFGMLQPGMYFENNDPRTRFGFNGMLRDDDIKDKFSTSPDDEGRGNSYATHFRMYDPRVARWFSLDPLIFEWESPYVAMGNNPIVYYDPDGASIKEFFFGSEASPLSPGRRGLFPSIGDFFSGLFTSPNNLLVPEITVEPISWEHQTAAEKRAEQRMREYAEWKQNNINPVDGFYAATRGTVKGILKGATYGLLDFGLNTSNTLEAQIENEHVEFGEEAEFYLSFALPGGLIKGAGKAAIKKGSNLLKTSRMNLLNYAENPTLKNIIKDLYRPGAKIGSGSAMDAYRLEIQLGIKVGGKSHHQKLLNYRTALKKLWNNRGNLSDNDKQIVKQLLGDIQNALSNY